MRVTPPGFEKFANRLAWPRSAFPERRTFHLELKAPLYSVVFASDLSENRFALFGPML